MGGRGEVSRISWERGRRQGERERVAFEKGIVNVAIILNRIIWIIRAIFLCPLQDPCTIFLVVYIVF